jgi:hypothetical protein
MFYVLNIAQEHSPVSGTRKGTASYSSLTTGDFIMPPRVVEIIRFAVRACRSNFSCAQAKQEVLQKRPVRQKFELSDNHYDSTDKRRLVDSSQRESGLPRTKPLFLGCHLLLW